MLAGIFLDVIDLPRGAVEQMPSGKIRGARRLRLCNHRRGQLLLAFAIRSFDVSHDKQARLHYRSEAHWRAVAAPRNPAQYPPQAWRSR
ncbi:MAG: hypothetical protein U1F18_06115 [Steroidobacteraceae bacterium]